MKLTYKRFEQESRDMPWDSRRWVVELNAVGLSQLGRVKNNPGLVAFAMAVRADHAKDGILAGVQGNYVHVQTTGIHHDWIWPVDERAKYVVLVWPFHAPKTWQIVGYVMKEDALSYPTNSDGGHVIPWTDFKPFVLTQKQEEHQPTSLYSAPPPTSNGRLQEASAD